MKLYKILLSLSVGLLALSASAQNRTVTGTVTDGASGDPVPFASIVALESQLGGRIWKTGNETRMKDQGPGYKARYEATWGFRPYPQMEISLSNGVLTQRPGWDSASALYTSWK